MNVEGRVSLRFSCPFIDVRFEPAASGIGPWRLTDLGLSSNGNDRGTVAIADGRVTPPIEAMHFAADAFLKRGWFRPVGCEAVVAAMTRAYLAQIPNDPVRPQVRRALADA